MPEIIDHTLRIASHSEVLPRLAQPAAVHVWSVPAEYRASGYYVSLQLGGQPIELPACDYRDATKIVRLELAADPDVAAAAEREAREQSDRALIAERRYLIEVGGVIIGGMPIDTGRDSQGLITGAALQAVIEPEYALRWKTSDGFVELAGQQILGVASAVRAHVQGCFNREAALLDAVAAGSFDAAMLDEGWPK